MSPLVFLLAVAKETFVGPRPTFYTPRYGDNRSVYCMHGMFTRAWQLEQVDIFLWCDNFLSLSEEMEKYLWTAKTGEKGRPSRPLLGHRPAGLPVDPIETRIDKTSGECDHREIASSTRLFSDPCLYLENALSIHGDNSGW